MLQYCVYLFYRTGVSLLGLLPLPVLFGLGQFAGAVAWLILPQYRALALRNVRIAFASEIPEREMRRIVRRHLQRLGANLLCSIKFTQMPIEKILERVRVENFEQITNCSRAKKPVVILLSHTGPWELCTRLFPHFVRDQRKSTIYQRLRNRYIDAHVRGARGGFGVEMLDRKEGFAKALGVLRSGGIVGILSDQHAGDSGLWTPFFGRLASTTSLPALLARRTGAIIIAFAVNSEGFARWRAVAEAPIEAESDSVESLTARGNSIIERQVRRAPEDWLWAHDRWKTPRPNFLLARYKRGVFVPQGQMLKPFRILLRSPNWLGDAIMSVPAVRAIKQGRPDTHVTVAVPEKIAAVWKLIAEVDEVIVLPGKSLVGAVRRLKQPPHFDVAILFPNSLRSALEVSLARVPRRVGFAGHGRSFFLNQESLAGKPRGIGHQAIKYLELAATVGAPIQRDFPAARPIDRERRPLKLALCPGAEYGPAKRWLPDRFAEVAKEIAAEFPVRWILLGTAKDAAIGLQVADTIGGAVENRIGKTNLEQLIAELRECDLLLTNDTGTMHLAGLLRVPTLTIFGSTEPRRTMLLEAGHQVLRHHVECSPCFLRECPLDFRCMHAVTSGEVVAVIRQMIKTPSPHSSPNGRGGREALGEGDGSMSR
jgi:heptosyltransferase-2